MSNIFEGRRFFLSRAIPQRTQLRETIEKHGGIVVLLEKDADIILVDHLRKTQSHPPNALSYQFAEQSVRRGKLEDPTSHRVGPAAPRPLGASNISTKSTRRSYTKQDDQIAFDWMYPWEQMKGAPTHGNKIYQDLAARFPHHTWQSWRTRYLKILRGKPRPGGGDPRPDLVYGGPEAVPRARPLSQAPESRVGSPSLPARSLQPAQIASRPSTQPSPPASSSRKRGPPSNSPPRAPEAASAPKRRLVEVPERATSVTRGSQDGSSKVVIRQPRTPPREPRSPVTETSVSAPDHNRHQNPSIPATGTTVAEINPPEQTVDLLFQQLPFYPSSSEPETVDGEEQEEDDDEEDDDEEDSDSEENSDISSWVQAQVAKGADISTVLDALRYTSMEPVLAKKLLKTLVAGEPVPDNMRGVWTEEDDRCLESQDARDVERVTKKHGDRLFQARWEYLEMARERGLVQ